MTTDASAFAGAHASGVAVGAAISAPAGPAGISAAGAAGWHAGVQQSIFPRCAGFAGILPSIVQPTALLDGWADALAGAGASASPSAQSNEIISRITRARIGGNAYLSMNGMAAERRGRTGRSWRRFAVRRVAPARAAA